MKIVILDIKENFTPEQQAKLATLGEVVYMNPPALAEHPMEKIVELTKGADLLGLDPDVFGGFEKGSKEKINKLIDGLPTLKGIALDTTSYGWIDVEYCKKKNIPVSNCPNWSKEAVAESAFALLFCLAKNIIKLDRKTQKGEYKLEQGFELKGKTLGVIGVGSIGSTIAQLARGIGMRVIGYNHSPKTVEGVEMKNTLDELLAEADGISIHVTHRDENSNMIGKDELAKMKDGVIIANFAAREEVDESAMAEAMKSGKVFGYAFEADNLEETPLKGIDNAIGLKPFAWYTKEALVNLYEILVDNIISLAEGKPQNIIN